LSLRDSVAKIGTSIIYVTRAPSLMLTLGAGGMSQIVEGPEVRTEGDAIVVSSMPNQFQAVITPNSVRFLDKSDKLPARTDFAARLVKLAEFIASENKLSYSAVGINFDIWYRREADERPSALILSRFVSQQAFAATGYDLIGAAVRLWYMARGMRHYIYFEPRGNQHDAPSYDSHLNVHLDLRDSLPTAKSMADAIHNEYEDFLRMIEVALEQPNGGGAQ